MDPDGNYTRYVFDNVNPHILSSIEYNAYNPPPISSNDPAPGERKTLSSPTATKVTIEYGTVIAGYGDGFLRNIRIVNQGSQGPVTVRRYALNYQLYTDWLTNVTVPKIASVTEFGGENGLSRSAVAFEYTRNLRLSAITGPFGARRALTWSVLSSGDRVSNVTTTGPGLATHSVSYSYGTLTAKATYSVLSYTDDEYRGYDQSWAQDVTTGIVRHTWWEVGSHALVGKRARVELALAAGPTIRTISYENVTRTISAPTVSGTCTAVSGEVPSTSYPVFTFSQRELHVDLNDGKPLSSQRTTSCADVDTWGNITRVAVDPDTGITGDDYVEVSDFEVAFDPSATCKDCVRERRKTDPAGSVLEASWQSYGQTFLPLAMYRRAGQSGAPGSSSYPLVTSWAYNPDGTLLSQTDGAVTTSYTYDPYQLRPATVLTADGANAALVTTTVYDDYGRPYSVIGPSVVGRPDPAPAMYYAYDALGRTRIIARQPFNGAFVAGAIAAFEYSEFAGTTVASTKAYDFVVPLNFTSQWTPTASVDPGIPQTSDVRQAISYVDGEGREIQVRERMGGTGSGDAGASITQNLSQYRVSKAIVYDGAGRITAALEPYYSANASYQDLSAGLDVSAGAVRVALSSYDAQGRPACTIARYATTALPAVGTCTSSFAESSSYAAATLFSYRGVTVNGQNFRAVRTIPPENNISTSMAGPESFYDAAGLLRWTTDAEGNSARYRYDRLARPTGTDREMASAVQGRLTTVTTTVVPDLMGRVTQRKDPNFGTRTIIYDPASPFLVSKVVFAKTGDEIRYTYDKGRTRTVTQCTKAGGTLTCPAIPNSTLSYDVPYSGGGSYAYTAGRVAWASNENATIAFGYDENGATVRRDQWLPGIAGGFATLETVTNDGRTVESDFSSPVSSFGYATSYDSAGRAVQISNGTAVYWAGSGSAATGYYDALGRIGASTRDGGLVQESWSYASYSALLLGHSVSMIGAAAPVYQDGGMTWRGTKLSSFTDSLSQTTYQYWYSNTGALVAAKAQPLGTSPLAQSSLVCMSYSATKAFGPGPGFGNIERTREGVSSPFVQDFAYSGTDVEASTLPPPPHLGGPDAATSIGSSVLGYDDYGRVASASGGAETFHYDLENRLDRITRPSGTSEVLSYDPFGALVSRQIGSTIIYYLPRRATVTGTLRNNGKVIAASLQVDSHVTLGGRRVASVRSGPGAPPRTVYYYRDRLGSVVATTLAGGLPGASYRYSAHGAIEVAVGDSGDSASELGFTGALKLSGGLLVMGVRVYNPALRIFMQPDPLAPYSYTYAAGDPVNNVDPTGMGTERNDPSLPVGMYGHSGFWSPPWVDGLYGVEVSSRWESMQMQLQMSMSISGGAGVGGGTDPAAGNEPAATPGSAEPGPEEQPQLVGPDGAPSPPPITLPDGKGGQPNEWIPVPGSEGGTRPIKWKPKFPVPSAKGGQPGASWDPAGHWDYDDGTGKSGHYLPDGTRFQKSNEISSPFLPRVPPSTVRNTAAAGILLIIIIIALSPVGA